MFLYRLAPEGFYAASDPSDLQGRVRYLHSDPFEEPIEQWQMGRTVALAQTPLMMPVQPEKVVGIGRNYVLHAQELDNPVPQEPLIFLKSTSSLIGPAATIVLPPESERVEFEGEIAVVLRSVLRRANADEARRAVLGITAACDVTARDLQRRDATFARAKSFDTFCPLGPAIQLNPQLEDVSVTTRVNGEVRQQGSSRDMIFGIVDLLVYVSRMITLFPGDVLLTGTPEGVGPLADGDEVEVRVGDLEPLKSPVAAWRRT